MLHIGSWKTKNGRQLTEQANLARGMICSKVKAFRRSEAVQSPNFWTLANVQELRDDSLAIVIAV